MPNDTVTQGLQNYLLNEIPGGYIINHIALSASDLDNRISEGIENVVGPTIDNRIAIAMANARIDINQINTDNFADWNALTGQTSIKNKPVQLITNNNYDANNGVLIAKINNENLYIPKVNITNLYDDNNSIKICNIEGTDIYIPDINITAYYTASDGSLIAKINDTNIFAPTGGAANLNISIPDDLNLNESTGLLIANINGTDIFIPNSANLNYDTIHNLILNNIVQDENNNDLNTIQSLLNTLKIPFKDNPIVQFYDLKELLTPSLLEELNTLQSITILAEDDVNNDIMKSFQEDCTKSK